MSKTYNVAVSYNAQDRKVTVTSPKTGLTLWLPVGTSWDGETANELVRRIIREVEQSAAQFGKDFVSGGTTITMTHHELLTWREAFVNMVDHFTP